MKTSDARKAKTAEGRRAFSAQTKLPDGSLGLPDTDPPDPR